MFWRKLKVCLKSKRVASQLKCIVIDYSAVAEGAANTAISGGLTFSSECAVGRCGVQLCSWSSAASGIIQLLFFTRVCSRCWLLTLQMLMCCAVCLVGVPLPRACTPVQGVECGHSSLRGSLVMGLISAVSYLFHVIETLTGSGPCFPIVL